MICAIVDLLARDGDRGGVVVRFDQTPEHRGACDVAAFANVGKQVVRTDVEWFKARETAANRQFRHLARRAVLYRLAKRSNMLGARAAATADQVDETALRKFADDGGHLLRRLVVFAELVRQPGVGIGTNARIGNPG